jgi:hypothetical protein
MSDKEQDDDVGLPKATVFKLIQGALKPCMPGGGGLTFQRSYQQI